MKDEEILRLLTQYKQGAIDADETVRALRRTHYEDLGFAKLDHERENRCGFPEVVYGGGKTTAQTVEILRHLYQNADGNLIVTHTEEAVYAAVKEEIPEAAYYPLPRLIAVRRHENENRGNVCVLCGGTSDLPVAEEAALTAELMDNRVERIYDVGVAGIHRLFAHQELLEKARVLVVVAGMEGALPSVVAGLVPQPVIAVPTSVGYGASFGGLAALLAMLNSCASGVTVVNIDNGFGAGYAASAINRLP